MDQIKFCSGPFSIYPVVKLLREKGASYKMICDNWEVFGYSLGLDSDEIDSLREKLESGRSELENIARDMLRLWKDGHEGDANLEVLHEALLDVKAEDLADAIREKFAKRPGENNAPPAAKKVKIEVKPESEEVGGEQQNGSETCTGAEALIDSPKMSRRMKRTQDSQEVVDLVSDSDDECDLNVPDEIGDFPLCRAIGEGESVASIKKMLDRGANVNVKSNDDDKDNAAHEVIRSLINETQTLKWALDVLDLLKAYGFNLLNEGDSKGLTALHYAMEYEDLNEDLLKWFFKNGANFNAVDKENEDSVVSHAFGNRQGAGIIQKLLDLGSNPEYKNKWEGNLLHISSLNAHESAMEMFIDKFSVSVQDKDGYTPLHHLFSLEDLDYKHVLKMLLRKRADFNATCKKGYVPLVSWIKFGKGNPFPTLMKTKDILPITEQIASAALNAIVEDIDRLRKFVPLLSQDELNDFAEFIKFLIEENDAKLRLKSDDRKWKLHKWDKLGQLILTRDFGIELRKYGDIKWRGELNQIKGVYNRELKFYVNSNRHVATVPIETVLLCLMTCKIYQGFVEVCQVLKKFCVDENVMEK